jgi:hypothetical protein
MHEDFELMLDLMDRTFRDFENAMPNKPVLVKMAFGMVFVSEKRIFIKQLFKNSQGCKVLLEQRTCY